MKISYSSEERELFLRLNNLRGILALVVLFSHIWGYTGIRILVPFNKIVTIAVAFFFFLSGYGMMRSSARKPGYGKEILMVKIPYLLWMAAAAYIFSFLFETVLSFGKGNTLIFSPFSMKQFFVSTNWYVWELIGFYLVFRICKKILREKYQVTAVFMISAAAFIILYYSGVVEAYYNSIIGFGLGMLYGSGECWKITEKYTKGWIAAAALLIFGFAGMIFMDKNGILFAAVRNLAAMGAIILALYLIRYINTCDRVNQCLSRISPELYFYHIPITMLLSNVIKNKFLYVLAAVGLTFLIAPIMNILNKKIQIKLKRLYTKI